MTDFDEMTALVHDLYMFRDHFFETHSINDAHLKTQLLSEKLDSCVQELDKISSSYSKSSKVSNSSAKAQQLYLRGRALNVLPSHSPEAEALLSRSVKLDPAFVEAWNELGECYWKRGDIETAQTCFEGALDHRENKVSLRNLSIVLRQRSTSSDEEKLRNIETGLSKAREAVQLDASDGTSWSILGNAHLAHFFSVSQNPRTLKQAMSAYKQAEKDPIEKSSPELQYNKGIALKYEEDYIGALESFALAQALDPTWPEPKEQESSMIRFLFDVQHLIEVKGKLKTKRFNSMLGSIDSNSGLGPVASSSRFREVEFSDLAEGSNDDKVVLGKVICSLHSGHSVPFTFCLTDRTGHCAAVNLYNLAPGKGVIIGDTVAVVEPKFSKVRVNQNSQIISFDLVRVDSPLVLIINGKKPGPEMQAGIELSSYTKRD